MRDIISFSAKRSTHVYAVIRKQVHINAFRLRGLDEPLLSTWFQLHFDLQTMFWKVQRQWCIDDDPKQTLTECNDMPQEKYARFVLGSEPCTWIVKAWSYLSAIMWKLMGYKCVHQVNEYNID